MKVVNGEEISGKANGFVFIHSRFCGTCHVARSFLDKIENTHQQELFYEINASLSPAFLQEYQIASVPCLLIIQHHEVKERIYTFYSVGNIYRYLYTYNPNLFVSNKK